MGFGLGFWFRVFGFWLLGFGFWVLGFGALGFGALGFGLGFSFCLWLGSGWV